MSDPKDFQNAPIIPGTNLFLQRYIEAKKRNNEEEYKKVSQQLRERMIEILSWAIKQLYTNDIKLFKLNKEETLSSRIAHYIECQLREGDFYGYYADVEYPFNDDKNTKLYGDLYINCRRLYFDKVDFLLAIEVKREDNDQNEDNDKERVQSFISLNQPLEQNVQDVRKNNHPIYGSLMGVFLRLKEEKGATADLYYYKSIEDNAPIMTMQITYKKENLYNPQEGEEREYTKTTSSNNKRQKQHSTKRTTNNR